MKKELQNIPSIFISYSHKDKEWKDRLVTHLGVLGKESHLETWDDRRIDSGSNWQAEIKFAIAKANAAILLISANFLTSDFILEQEVIELLRGRDKEGVRIYPLIIKPCAWEGVAWLKAMQLRPIDGNALSGMSEYDVDKILANVGLELLELFKQTQTKITFCKSYVEPEKITLSRLPVTSSMFFGRKELLQQLDVAWNQNHTGILSLLAWGGVGKSALINHWLRRLKKDNYRGAQRIYGWSFYSQGNNDQTTSVEPFIQHALGWFGDPVPKQGSPWEKGERLANLIRSHKTLMILDGLEPMQHPPGSEEGRLKEISLQALLRELAAHNPGLCIISSRVDIADLEDYKNDGYLAIMLENLSDQAGGELLSYQGARGTNSELEQASRDFGGHALALTLLGHYLSDVYEGDIRCRNELPPLEEDERHGGHARRVMRSYEKWLGEGPELAILRLIGLFDRPAEVDAINAVRAEPILHGLTETLQDLDDHRWSIAIKHLRRIDLLSANKEDENNSLDAHPLVREHFRNWLQQEQPKVWQEGNSRLFDYFRNTAEPCPETLEQMTPLFLAMFHGCEAGEHMQALGEVYCMRINRGDESYCSKFLGAYGSDLAALSGLFNTYWSQPIEALNKEFQAYVLHQAGFNLSALGRLSEAIEPLELAMKAHAKQKNWKEAANTGGTLSEIKLTLGRLAQAQSRAKLAVIWADQSNSYYKRMAIRTTLADALFQSGDLMGAKNLFHEAEQILRKEVSGFPTLYSLWGYRYCELLLELGQYKEARKRAENSLKIVLESSQYIGDIARNHLMMGYTYLFQVQLGKESESYNSLQRALYFLDQGVEELRKAGSLSDLPRGLLIRAAIYRMQNNYQLSQRDLNETFRLTQRSGMLLFEADAYVEQTRLMIEQSKIKEAKSNYGKAKSIIEKTGYHRRDKVLKELAEHIALSISYEKFNKPNGYI